MRAIWELFLIYLKIGAFTIGGGYAMIPLIEVEVVEKKKWMSSKEFMDMFAVIQSAPGPIAVNSAVFLGYKIGGVKGSIAGTLGAVLPSFTIILFIAAFLTNFKEYEFVEGIFKGVRPAVVALIAGAVYKLGKASELSKMTIPLFAITLIGIIFLDIHPILLILAAAIISIFVTKKSIVRRKE